MEAFQERMLRELTEIRAAQRKFEVVDGISAQLEALDAKLSEQSARLDQVQVKVDLSCDTLGQVQQSKFHAATKGKPPEGPESSSPTATEVSDGILGAGPSFPTSAPPRPVQSPHNLPVPQPVVQSVREESSGKRQWMPKIDFPRFDGSDVRIWLDKCEAFFKLYNIPNSFKLTSASLYLTDNAAHWYQAFKQTSVYHTWPQFCAAIVQEFDVNVYRQKMKELMSLKQLESAELRATVELQIPSCVQSAAMFAAVQEGLLQQKSVRSNYAKTPFTKTDSRPALAPGELWKAKQLKEYRRANGLCYKCGEKFTPGHVCSQVLAPGAQLKAAEAVGQNEIISDALLDALVEQSTADCATISVTALSGAAHPNTIQLRALVGNQVVLILMDSGSTHTFVDQALLSRISVTVDQLSQPMKVKVANGEVVQCTEVVSQLTWWIQGHNFTNAMHVLPLGGHDIILGMDWLEQWGVMQCHWAEKWIQFQYAGQEVKLQGVLPVTPTVIEEVSVEQLVKWEKGNEVWATAVLNRIVMAPETPIPPTMQELLDKHTTVFTDPQTLPPHRPLDHAIHLVPGAVPVNYRPYRYSPQQKDEIERQVAKMLKAGLITPSISPFASPVLLVKKKDGTWRFCVDYRRLNAITIKSKFPLPVIDELLDELGGAKWFSKLDLKAGYHQIRMKEEDEHKTAFKTHHGDQLLTSDLQRKAMTKLVGLQFSIQYKKGVENTVADALSRVAHLFPLQAISTSKPVWIQEVLNSYSVDSAAQGMLQKLAVDSKACPGFQLQDGLIKHGDKIWIGANTGLQTKLIQAFHSTPVGGLSGILPTYHRVKQLFSWTGMKTDVENFVKQCNTCQQAKHELCKTPGLLQPLPVPDRPWQAISMDFIEGLPKSEGFSAILVVVDRFTKVSHFLALKHPFTAASVAKVFLNNIVKLHGLPLTIVSDRDKIFTSAFWRELFRVWGTELQMSTAYHPQTDGQTERVNQCLEMYLRCAVHDSPTKWAAWLPRAEFWYNSTYHSALGCTPYKALYGQDPNVGQLAGQSTSLHPDVQTWLASQPEHTTLLKDHLARAQCKYKHFADKKRSDRQFAEGEMVYLRLQPYAQSSVVNRPCPKLALKYFGPFKVFVGDIPRVLEKVGNAAYKLELPRGSMVHPVFHVSQLKGHVPDHTPVFTTLPVPLDLSAPGVIPEEILDRRLVKKGNASYLQILVKWSSIPAASATWEDYQVLKERYLDAPAWGHAGSSGGGIVSTLQMTKARARRGKREAAKVKA
ncbi:uncharacterized protein [Aegilops tauschii subsp. strangulata]|uniref:uncharacterized protein n=1 Tax=Aegilops tauschii subsp. strangulata TaxID=200361 RepID=UPI003CC8AF03